MNYDANCKSFVKLVQFLHPKNGKMGENLQYFKLLLQADILEEQCIIFSWLNFTC